MKTKHIIFVLIILLVGCCISVYATYSYLAYDIMFRRNDGVEISVDTALKELYKNYNINHNLEKKLQLTQQSINHTYTIPENGIYLVATVSSYSGKTKASITTNSTVILEEEVNESSEKRTFQVKLINGKANETVSIVSQNGKWDSESIIYKLNNINLNNVVFSDITVDDETQYSYTANTDENMLVLAMNCGQDKWIKTTGDVFNLNITDNAVFIDYLTLKNGDSFTLSSYGYNYGSGAIMILK